jgi:hypothetical protein
MGLTTNIPLCPKRRILSGLRTRHWTRSPRRWLQWATVFIALLITSSAYAGAERQIPSGETVLLEAEGQNQPGLEPRFLLASISPGLNGAASVSATPSPLVANAALSPTVLSTAQQTALCQELCPTASVSCAIKFIYGTGTTYCCSGTFFVHGSIGHRCSDQSLPKIVPNTLLSRIIAEPNISGAAAADKPPGTITQANTSALTLIGRSALQRINQVRAAQQKEPIIWSQAVYESVSYWLSYLDSTHLFITQNLGQPAKPFPPGALFLAEVVLAQRLPENVTAAEAGVACGNALLSGNISAEITLGNYEFGAVGALPRSAGPEWLCSISLGNLFRYGGTSFPNTTQT